MMQLICISKKEVERHYRQGEEQELKLVVRIYHVG